MIKRTFKLTDNDLTFNTDRNIAFVSGDEEIKQALERIFTTNAGEWFLNALHGLEYTQITGKSVTNEAIQMAVIKAALQEARVREVISIEIEKDAKKRTVDIIFNCVVDEGAVIAVPFNFN